MSDAAEDQRETSFHPRFDKMLLGHDAAWQKFSRAFASGKPHHAWLLAGPRGVGKASFAYKAARHVLASGGGSKSDQWVANRTHPDLAVLQCAMAEGKTARLKSEISVEDVHAFTGFFARTASAGDWRVGVVDAADDLNSEGANALLKLVEEPPGNSLIFIINHQPGKLLRTLRSRCLRLTFHSLSEANVEAALRQLPWETEPDAEQFGEAIRLCGGRPGWALDLLGNDGAKAFAQFLAIGRLDARARLAISNNFNRSGNQAADYRVFMELLMDWLASRAEADPTSHAARAQAEAHSALQSRLLAVEGYNLDRRVAVLEALSTVQQALKAA
jgi:DNA polymerase-3 subunit delta'